MIAREPDCCRVWVLQFYNLILQFLQTSMFCKLTLTDKLFQSVFKRNCCICEGNFYNSIAAAKTIGISNLIQIICQTFRQGKPGIDRNISDIGLK